MSVALLIFSLGPMFHLMKMSPQTCTSFLEHLEYPQQDTHYFQSNGLCDCLIRWRLEVERWKRREGSSFHEATSHDLGLTPGTVFGSLNTTSSHF